MQVYVNSAHHDNGHAVDYDAVVGLMDEDLREQLHETFPADVYREAGHSEATIAQWFVSAYEREHLRKYGEPFVVD